MQDVVARLHSIDDKLSRDDGAAVFNHMYLTVTEQVAAGLAGAQVFRNPVFMEQLDVTFAGLWLDAYDAPGDAVPKAWAPLFAQRHNLSLLPIQFALAGMNSHIAHDLPVAVVRTCRELNSSPNDPGLREDYEAVNGLLAARESEVRRSFLTVTEQAVDNQVGPVVHLIGAGRHGRHDVPLPADPCVDLMTWKEPSGHQGVTPRTRKGAPGYVYVPRSGKAGLSTLCPSRVSPGQCRA